MILDFNRTVEGLEGFPLRTVMWRKLSRPRKLCDENRKYGKLALIGNYQL